MGKDNLSGIIIPTKTRPEFVKRALRYYLKMNCPHKIYIGDGSNISMENSIEKLVHGSNLKVSYYNWPNLGGLETQFKLAEIAQEEDIKYLAYSGDDDFIIPNSLSKCADFLGKNTDYATAQGRAALIQLNHTGAHGEIDKLGVYWDKKNLTCETAIDRFKEILQNYFVLEFSVHRTNDFLVGNKMKNIIDPHWGEIYRCCSFAIQGKSKFLDNLYLIRHTHTDIKKFEYMKWITSPNWYKSFHQVSKNLHIQLNDKSVSLQAIQNNLGDYILAGLLRKQKSREKNYRGYLKDTIKRKLPILKSSRDWLLNLNKSRDNLLFMDKEYSIFYEDFQIVRKIIRN